MRVGAAIPVASTVPFWFKLSLLVSTSEMSKGSEGDKNLMSALAVY